VWAIVTDFTEKQPWWDAVSDLILLPLGGVGIVLYLFGVEEPIVKSIWKVVTVVIIVGQLFSNIGARHLVLSGQTEVDTEDISQWGILFSDLAIVIVLAPMALINVFYAFSL
jgi:hypothetical protein